MGKTIEHTAIDMLNRRGWKYDTSRRSPAWVDPLKRTDKAIYLGSRGSIRLGTTKTDSRPVNGLAGLGKFLERIEAIHVVPVDTSVQDEQRKANDARKAELVKLHNTLRGITPLYEVRTIGSDGDGAHSECVVGLELFSTLDEVDQYIAYTFGDSDPPDGIMIETWVRIK